MEFVRTVLEATVSLGTGSRLCGFRIIQMQSRPEGSNTMKVRRLSWRVSVDTRSETLPVIRNSAWGSTSSPVRRI